TFNTTFGVAPTASSELAVGVTASGVCSIAGGTVTMTSGTGTCTLTAAQAGDSNYSAATDVAHDVAAQKASQTISFTQPTSPATFNTTFGVAPTASSELAVGVTASGVCSIAGGTVTMTSGTGTCTLTAAQAGDSNYSAATSVAHDVAAQKASQTISFTQPTSPATFNTTFGVAPTASSELAVGVTASGVCSIAGGTVTMTSGTGTCTLTAAQAGDSNYSAATSVAHDVAAQKASQTISFTQPTSPATFNTTFGVAPTASSELAVGVTASGVCSIASGTVTMTSGTGTCTLTAAQAGDSNYNAATNVARYVAAQKASQTISFTAPASPATFNTTFGVAPTASSALTVGVTASGVCSIASGTVTMTSGTGTCTLTAAQAGDSNYSAATNVARDVAAQKASQTISFTAPPSPATFNSPFAALSRSSSALTVGVTASGVCSIVSGTVTMTS